MLAEILLGLLITFSVVCYIYFHVDLTSKPLGTWQIPDDPQEFVILQYLSFFEVFWREGNAPFKFCQYKNCRWTNQKSDLFRSNAVIFHLSDFKENTFPPPRHHKQKWLAFSQEPVEYVGVKPEWRYSFNSTITYNRRSVVWTPYGIFSKKPPDRPVQGNKSAIATKTKMVAWMVSNCKTRSRRELYVKELQKYIDVDVYGGCGNLTCSRRYEISCRKMVEQNYKFYLAFENSLCEDYVSEKLFEALKHYVVPLVMADVDLVSLAPPNSYIDIRNFPTPEKLANFLLEVAANQTKYLSYFEWKESYTISGKSAVCGMCEYLNKNWNKTEILDTDDFWNRDLQCVSGETFLTDHFQFNQSELL